MDASDPFATPEINYTRAVDEIANLDARSRDHLAGYFARITAQVATLAQVGLFNNSHTTTRDLRESLRQIALATAHAQDILAYTQEVIPHAPEAH